MQNWGHQVDIVWFVVFSVAMSLLISHVAEMRRSKENTDFLQFVGAVEDNIVSKLSFIFRTLLICVVFASLLHYSLEPHPYHSLSVERLFLGVIMAIFGLALKYWALVSTGRYWSHRCFYVPGFPLQKLGPYKILGHPEWLGRMIEVAGLWVILHYSPIGGAILSMAMIFAVLSALKESQFLVACRKSDNLQPDRSNLRDEKSVAFG